MCSFARAIIDTPTTGRTTRRRLTYTTRDDHAGHVCRACGIRHTPRGEGQQISPLAACRDCSDRYTAMGRNEPLYTQSALRLRSGGGIPASLSIAEPRQEPYPGRGRSSRSEQVRRAAAGADARAGVADLEHDLAALAEIVYRLEGK